MMSPDEQYNQLMDQIKSSKAENGLTYADIALSIDRSRHAAMFLMQSDNMHLKGFIRLANAVGLEVKLNKIN